MTLPSPPRPRGRLTRRLMAVAIALAAVWLSQQGEDDLPEPAAIDTSRHAAVAVFGATGLVGEGVLAAMRDDPAVRAIHVVTRRTSPAIDAMAASGRATVWMHRDFLDYEALGPMLAEVDAVYWALGTSTWNVSNEEYSVIHVDFPARFVTAWLAARGRAAPLAFHLVSGSGASADAWFHWAREKARAEQTLFDLARGTGLRVVAHRPGGVLREGARARWYTAPLQVLKALGRGIEPTAIGQAMLEVTARGSEVPGGILENRDLLRFANGYQARAGR